MLNKISKILWWVGWVGAGSVYVFILWDDYSEMRRGPSYPGPGFPEPFPLVRFIFWVLPFVLLFMSQIFAIIVKSRDQEVGSWKKIIIKLIIIGVLFTAPSIIDMLF